ncbi:MAG: efflux RND transporter permease subunit, partial [Nitrospinae bacterium]|nr:efflux RND transporter permease subunit [Nitrospinota bacterium]
ELLTGVQDAPRVVLGAGIGRDAAVLDFSESSDRLLVAKTDPITFATARIGWYAVNVNANDIACMGADPAWFLATVLLPEGSRESLATDIFSQIEQACAELGVTLVGGHTEVTIGIDRPIVAMVLSIMMVILGVVAMVQLPTALFPDIAPPEIVLEANYVGADALTVEDAAGEYLIHCQDRARLKSWRQKRRLFEKWVLPRLGNLPLCELDRGKGLELLGRLHEGVNAGHPVPVAREGEGLKGQAAMLSVQRNIRKELREARPVEPSGGPAAHPLYAARLGEAHGPQRLGVDNRDVAADPT